MKVGGPRTVGPSTVRSPAVHTAKPPGIPIHRKPPVLFYVPRRQPWRRNLCHARSATRRGPNRRTQRQDFAFNLWAKRRLCNTVRRIGGIARACAEYRCAITAARSRAATISDFAPASLTLVLRALFGAPKSCALVNLFMICPRCRRVASDDDQILSVITAIWWHLRLLPRRFCLGRPWRGGGEWKINLMAGRPVSSEEVRDRGTAWTAGDARRDHRT